jgi:hypothetical protein
MGRSEVLSSKPWTDWITSHFHGEVAALGKCRSLPLSLALLAIAQKVGPDLIVLATHD